MNTGIAEIRLREKGQVTIPSEILQEWWRQDLVKTNDTMEAVLLNGVVMLIPKKRHQQKRDIMSYAGAGKGVWWKTPEEIETSIQNARNSWTR